MIILQQWLKTIVFPLHSCLQIFLNMNVWLCGIIIFHTASITGIKTPIFTKYVSFTKTQHNWPSAKRSEWEYCQNMSALLCFCWLAVQLCTQKLNTLYTMYLRWCQIKSYGYDPLWSQSYDCLMHDQLLRETTLRCQSYDERTKAVTSPCVNWANLKPTLHNQLFCGDITVCGFPKQLIVHHVVLWLWSKGDHSLHVVIWQCVFVLWNGCCNSDITQMWLSMLDFPSPPCSRSLFRVIKKLKQIK